jgi:predicted DNA-binding transcriptional regulator AlpA
MQFPIDPILTEKELASWLATSCPTLQRLRSNGDGPPFIQLSTRRIGYRRSAVDRWLADRTITRTGAQLLHNSVSQVTANSASRRGSGHD